MDKYEKEIENALEAGKMKKVKNVAPEKKELVRAAKFTLAKTRNINIRIAEKDLQKLKARAMEKGIPYQTLASSILHQYSDGRVREMV
jgi:predicted DNA binding CopG/RHH family protein